MAKPSTTLFDDDKRLLEKAKEYIEVRQRLEQEARRDPSQTPTPTRLALELKITVEEVLFLSEFAQEVVSDELQWILENASAFRTMDGQLADRLQG